MARSTPGTRFRTAFVKQLRVANRSLSWALRDWTLNADGKVHRTEGEIAAAQADGDYRYWRPRLLSEYPENSAKALRRTYQDLTELQELVTLLKDQVADRWRAVMTENQEG